MATKDKGKAAITAIKYSALDRAMLFSFYNHSQPLWVWADGTSISPGKLDLHVDVGGRGQGQYKRRSKRSRKRSWEKRPRTRASQTVSRRQTSRSNMVQFCMNTTTNYRPVTKAQPFKPTLYKFYCLGLLTYEPNVILGSLRIEFLQLPNWALNSSDFFDLGLTLK